ncbi:Nn.00g109320.m01.CDS01 [Neocucurbitaria sp. VM-36]
MLITAIILAPAAVATPAVQDLVDLRTVINAAAKTIGDPNNPNKGWGLGLFGGGGNQMGTADLVNNITMTILRSKFQLDTNKTSWLLPNNTADTTNRSNVIVSPTLPLTASIVNPSVVPTTTPTPNNTTTDLSAPYIDYVSSFPNLGTSLTSLGRSYHKEMNLPVHEAIDVLQQSISAFQSTVLQSDLISSQAIIRAIRANSALEDAQQAWSRFLNLPGRVSESAIADDGDSQVNKKREATFTRPPPAEGEFYTHKELWGRNEPTARQLKEGEPTPCNTWEEKHVRMSEEVRVGQPYVA